jgi:hypothetical protein
MPGFCVFFLLAIWNHTILFWNKLVLKWDGKDLYFYCDQRTYFICSDTGHNHFATHPIYHSYGNDVEPSK